MREKLLTAIAQANAPKLKQAVRVNAVTVRYASQRSFEREMERRRYGK